MVRIRTAVCAVLLVVLAGGSAHALEAWALYDNFSAATINPNKWFGVEGNPFGPVSGVSPGYGTDATRLAQAGKLRMSYLSFGATTTDSGETASSLRLHFINPSAITAFKATVNVRNFTLVNCQTNSATATRARLRLQGAFFNASTPTPGEFTNDVFAVVRLQRTATSTDPPGVFRAQGFAFRCIDPACNTSEDLPGVLLGFATAGTPATLSVLWDPDNNKFIYGFNSTIMEETYPWSDSSPPGIPNKRLDLQSTVQNCTSTPRPKAFINATFDNVFVNASGAMSLDSRVGGR